MVDDPKTRFAARFVATVSSLARLGLAAVWLVAGVPKLLGDPLTNELAVRAYRLVPESLVSPVTVGQPLLEVALGVLLLVGLGTRIAAVVSAVVFALYIFGIAWVWSHGYKIDCGCFSSGGEDASATGQKYALEIARDTGFLLLALWLSWRPRSFFALGPRSRASLSDPAPLESAT